MRQVGVTTNEGAPTLASTTPRYGSASVLTVVELPSPDLGPNDVRVQVYASPVTAGDLRLRAADFPALTAPIGRLMFGRTAPRNPVQGTMFDGRVLEVGSEVSRWAAGDDVFGAADHGAWAQQLVLDADATIAHLPEGIGYDEAAALPYGAGTALHFLRDVAQVQPGDRVLLLGASGGVGRHAVTLAKHLGAEVTAVCSPEAFDLVRELGADHLIDYRTQDPLKTGTYDVIFDLAEATTFPASRHALSPTGRFVTLYMTLSSLWAMAWTALTGGPRAPTGVAMPNAQAMAEIGELAAAGAQRPHIAARSPLNRIAEAHAAAEEGIHGEILATVSPAARGPSVRSAA